MKLGLKDPRPGAVKLRFATYLNHRKLPKPPATFGHEDLIKQWGVFGNDEYGCCGPAGAAHVSMLWCAESGTAQAFDTTSVLKNYSAVTSPPFTPSDPSTDTGVDLDDLAKYWRQEGLVDAKGARHQIVAYVDMSPGDLRELWLASYLFQAAVLGFALPQSAMDQTKAGQVWDDVGDSNILGGHCVPNMGKHAGMGDGITWGKHQPFTAAFYVKYMNQGIVAFSEEMMIQAHSIDGFDDAGLRADVAAITAE